MTWPFFYSLHTRFFFFFFENPHHKTFIQLWLWKSAWSTFVISGGTSSIQTCNEEKEIARLTSEWATVLLCLLIWEKEITENWEAKYCISLIMWPNYARLWEFDFRAFMRISESPSNTPLLRPVSNANSIARELPKPQLQ